MRWRQAWRSRAVASARQAPVGERYWPQWRGPHGTGFSKTATPPTEWSETKNIRWKVEIPGRGSASPVVWGDRVFVLSAVPVGMTGDAVHAARGGQPLVPHKFMVLALDRKTGKVLWERVAKEQAPHEASHPENGTWASASAATDGEHVIASFDSFGYYAYDMNGKLIWEKDLGDKRMRSTFGEGSTPALFGNRLVVQWDHQGQSFVAAFDKRTGQEVWRQNRTEIDSWAMPLIVPVNGRPQVITVAMNQVKSYDLETGDVVWFTARPDDEPDSDADFRRVDGLADERVSRQQPQGDSAERREGRHHGHARGGVDARPRHALRPVAAPLRQHPVFPEVEQRPAVGGRCQDGETALLGASGSRRCRTFLRRRSALRAACTSPAARARRS